MFAFEIASEVYGQFNVLGVIKISQFQCNSWLLFLSGKYEKMTGVSSLKVKSCSHKEPIKHDIVIAFRIHAFMCVIKKYGTI